MNTHIRILSVLTIAFCAFKAQAYTYKITNLTNTPYSVQLKLMFFGVETPWQDNIGTVQPGESLEKEYGAGDAYTGFCFSQLAIDNDPVYVIHPERAFIKKTDYFKKLVQDFQELAKFWEAKPQTHNTNTRVRDQLSGSCGSLSFYIIPRSSAYGVVGYVTGYVE